MSEGIHPCLCTTYNGGQCYNCLNGAHSLCPTCKIPDVAQPGLKLVFRSKEIDMVAMEKNPVFRTEVETIRFAENLWTLMETRKIDGAALAKKAGLGPHAVRNILSGRGNLSLTTMVALAIALDAKVEITLRANE